MTHAWLFTGPPGCGRSVAARAFAAALLCPDGGCGHCPSCHQVRAGTHADLLLVRPDGLSYGVKQTRSLVLRAAAAPSGGRWQVVLFEDADRATEQAANALLKAIEEPPPRTVWLLCAPSADDLVTTIRSRCRLVTSAHPAGRRPSPRCSAPRASTRTGRSPPPGPRRGTSAGRAGSRTDADARSRRDDVLAVPPRLTGAGSRAVGRRGAGEGRAGGGRRDHRGPRRARARCAAPRLRRGLDRQGGGQGRRGVAGAMKDLEDRQKSRATRLKRDALDRALLDLAAFYRDVLAVQVGAAVDLASAGHEADVRRLAEPPRRRLGAPDPGRHDLPGAAGAERGAAARGRGDPWRCARSSAALTLGPAPGDTYGGRRNRGA